MRSVVRGKGEPIGKTRGWLASRSKGLVRGLLVFIAVLLVGLCLFSVWVIYTMTNPPHSSYQAALADLDGDGY